MHYRAPGQLNMSFLGRAKQPWTPESSSAHVAQAPGYPRSEAGRWAQHQHPLHGCVDALFIAQLLPTPAISSQELPTHARQITTLGLSTQSREGKSKNTFVCSQPEVNLFSCFPAVFSAKQKMKKQAEFPFLSLKEQFCSSPRGKG